MWIQRLNVFNKTELYNPSKYENRTKDIADHVKINKKISAICIVTSKISAVEKMIEMWPWKKKSSCLQSWRLSEGRYAKRRKEQNHRSFEFCDEKNQCLRNIGVGSLWDNKKCELAANNGDTLGEAVISAKGTNSD